MRGTSPPRTLSSQAIESGWVISATSAPLALTVPAMRARLAPLLSPANSSGCGSTGASGAGGRSRHTESTGLESTGTKLAAGALAGAGEAVMAVDRHQPGIEAELAALGQVLGDPRLGRFLGDLVRHEGVGIDLGAHRQCVAAVDEDRRAIGQHDGKAGRAAEAGEPREPLRAPRHVLALMLVGARHDEAVEAALPELGAQRGQARHRRGRGAEPVIGPRQLLAPGLERPGELGICTGIDQFDPFRAGQALGGCGNAAHQGIEGRGIRVSATLAEQVEDVVWGGTHVGGTLRGRFRRGNLRNFRTLATAKCAIR